MVQSAAWYPLKPLIAACDFVTLSAHKLGGPKGAGILVARRNAWFEPMVVGGGQERDRRSGTENVAAIVGMAEALECAQTNVTEVAGRIGQLRERLWRGLKGALGEHIERITPEIQASCAPHILQVLTFGPDGRGLDGEMLLLGLDMAGVQVSAGSACSSGSLKPSHVLAALGIPEDRARGVVRFSLGHQTSAEEIDHAVDRTVSVIRRMQRQA
jgi:cysteine desulfurase